MRGTAEPSAVREQTDVGRRRRLGRSNEEGRFSLHRDEQSRSMRLQLRSSFEGRRFESPCDRRFAWEFRGLLRHLWRLRARRERRGQRFGTPLGTAARASPFAAERCNPARERVEDDGWDSGRHGTAAVLLAVQPAGMHARTQFLHPGQLAPHWQVRPGGHTDRTGTPAGDLRPSARTPRPESTLR